MSVVVCPGIHAPELTQSFIAGLRSLVGEKERLSRANDFNWNLLRENLLIFPASDYPAFSSVHILQWLRDRFHHPPTVAPLVFIGFSAGAVGAIGAAWGWQMLGGGVKAVIALDGWGVPLAGTFPIHRLSHDNFTHWSSALLGSGEDSFYAEPPISHLQLWRSPQTVAGWWVHLSAAVQPRSRTTAAKFVAMLLKRYQEC